MKTFILFLIMGVVGFVVDFIVFLLAKEYLGFHAGRILAFILAVNMTFILNSNITFPDANKRYMLYVFGQSKGFAISFIIFELMLFFYDDVVYIEYFAFIMGSITALLFNFFYAKHLSLRAH